jgi:hypothetical protein
MRTPAGKECSHFYGDYYRGRQLEECRLLKDAGLSWTERLCQSCPVPEIQSANSCEHQQLIPDLKRPLFFMRPEVTITAYCTKSNQEVEEPRVGCGQCHPDLPQFVISSNDSDPAD